MGERALELNPSLVGESWPSNPSPTTSSFSSSGGGVGVRGGIGSGITDAMVSKERRYIGHEHYVKHLQRKERTAKLG
jgi:hypothetical protein